MRSIGAIAGTALVLTISLLFFISVDPGSGTARVCPEV